MPLGCMNQVVGNQIGSTMGKVEDVAVAEDDVGWGRYLRVRVAINLFKPLERGRTLFISGNSCWVSFKYEKLPVFCLRCGYIIHGPKGCAEGSIRKPFHGEGSNGWGLWLRADDASKRWGGPKMKKADSSSSPVRSGQGQRKEALVADFPDKGSNKPADNQETSAESCPRMHSRSRPSRITATILKSQNGKEVETTNTLGRTGIEIERIMRNT
jgi:hypothetical protein